MYWRAGKPERFVRPVRWVVALLDAAVVPLEIAGIAAGNASRGHRMLHGEAPVVIAQPKSYAEALREAKVVVRCGRAQAVDPQGAGQGDADGCRRALARG